MRENWTDERLDDLNQRVDNGFKRVDEELRALRTEMNTRFDSMQRAMFHGVVALSASIVAGFGGMAGLLAVVA